MSRKPPIQAQIEQINTCMRVRLTFLLFTTQSTFYKKERKKQKVRYLLLRCGMRFVGVRGVRYTSSQTDGFGVCSEILQWSNILASHLLEEACCLSILRFHHHPLPAVASRSIGEWVCAWWFEMYGDYGVHESAGEDDVF